MKYGNLIVTSLAALLVSASAFAGLEVKGFTLTQDGIYTYDATEGAGAPTEAQKAVDYIYSIGGRHVQLTPLANMDNGTTSTIVPQTPLGPARSKERQAYGRLIRYIHSKGMTVGIRPIILVKHDPNNPNVWHGNIKPADPIAWFNSLRSYLDMYVNIAVANPVEEFTVGAELWSMSVGVEVQGEDPNDQTRYGYPKQWTDVIHDIRAKLSPKTRMMYDMNFTDVASDNSGIGALGGELERWRYRLVDLKPTPAKPATMAPASAAAWQTLVDLWKSIDYVGIDLYASLASKNDIPRLNAMNYNELEQTLEAKANEFAGVLDNALSQIADATGVQKKIIIKETGYKSCAGCYVDPFVYDDGRRAVSIDAQAAGYQATFAAFVTPGWDWMGGISFWDVSTDPNRSGAADPGFTPRGKAKTEGVIRAGWGN